ncbi:hypothetical protein PIB30_030120 [Stylosanthes scabra]|uniref:Uncharacterized protein n=1 Tax=Stylosanthes scabra TaxID=79078 RepID=A0ABU6YC23_9FABA|nr:hypothetical protein [Stylosanthes scabra]
MQRPPPEPPDSYWFEVEDGEPESTVDEDTADQKRNGCVGNGTGAAFRSAEVSTFVNDKESLTEGVVTGTEDSAFLTGMVKNLHDGDKDRRSSGRQRNLQVVIPGEDARRAKMAEAEDRVRDMRRRSISLDGWEWVD